MMGLFQSLSGVVQIEITSAAISELLASVNQKGIEVFDVVSSGNLSVKCTIRRSDLQRIYEIVSRRGEQIQIVGKIGAYWTVIKFLRRPFLLVGVICLLFCVFYLPSRVFFVSVEGNHKIPANLIIEKAEFCGIGFGASRRQVRSEQVKNALLGEIPQLQWVGVNTYGCVAVITVRERTLTEETENKSGVSSVIAAKDGVIWNCTVWQGNPLCKVGQAVKAGQVLVSGYMDLGICIKATKAEAEIIAQTMEKLSVISPSTCEVRENIKAEDIRYSLLVGKKLINFYKDSGISDTRCVKIKEIKFLTLPGGFRLPIALIKEKVTSYDYDTQSMNDDDTESWLKNYSEDYLKTQMVAGEILQKDYVFEKTNGLYSLVGNYICLEMIGRIQNEETLPKNGKYD